MSTEHWFNDNGTGNPKYREKKLSKWQFDTNPTRTDVKSNPGLRGEGLATDRLRHGTTSKMKMTPKMQLYLACDYHVNQCLNTKVKSYNWRVTIT
jgi:hypothetical protein